MADDACLKERPRLAGFSGSREPNLRNSVVLEDAAARLDRAEQGGGRGARGLGEGVRAPGGPDDPGHQQRRLPRTRLVRGAAIHFRVWSGDRAGAACREPRGSTSTDPGKVSCQTRKSILAAQRSE